MAVSIRAPASRPGRPRRLNAASTTSAFQSAPRPRDRGDTQSYGATPRNQWFQSAPRPRDRGDCDLPNWPSRKDFVAHFRQPASFSCGSNVCDVKEQEKFCIATILSRRRETTASQPSLMVRGSAVIKSAVRSNQRAFPRHDVQFVVWRFHPNNKIAASPRRF